MLTRRQQDLIAAAIRSVADETVSEHFVGITQEHQLSSRLAQALEKTLPTMTVFGKRVHIVVQEAPDKGPRSLEKPTGIDLYVTVTDTDPDGFSKGFFVQAKWKVVYRPPVERDDLIGQCKKMIGGSDQSYVWLYGPTGIEVVRAQEVVAQPHRQPETLDSRDTDELFREILVCNEGDPRLGVQGTTDTREIRRRMEVMLEELRAETGLAIVITSQER